MKNSNCILVDSSRICAKFQTNSYLMNSNDPVIKDLRTRMFDKDSKNKIYFGSKVKLKKKDLPKIFGDSEIKDIQEQSKIESKLRIFKSSFFKELCKL